MIKVIIEKILDEEEWGEEIAEMTDEELLDFLSEIGHIELLDGATFEVVRDST